MGNVFKNFALNKVTVTILGVVASAAVLIIGYSYRTNTSGSTRVVYYVVEAVEPNTQLTEAMIKKVRINSTVLETSPDMVTSLDQIKDSNGEFFFVNYGHSLTAGKILYLSDLIAKENKADEKLYRSLKDGQTVFKINVDMKKTHGNSIQKGNAIDVYVEGKDEDGGIIYTKFVENLKVIDVVDNEWATTSNTSSEEAETPRFLLTAVDYELFDILSKVTLLNDYEFELIPEDTRKTFDESSTAKIVNESIKSIVEANTAYTN